MEIQNLKHLTPKEQAIQNLIETIWIKYDVDKSGVLNKGETKLFIKETFRTIDSK